MPGSSQRNSRNEKRNKKDGEDYIKASSHRDIAIWVGPFALRITRANSCLKKFRQLVGEGWIFMKIKSLRCIQMLQLIRTIISIKKRHTKLVLEVIKRQPWIRVRDQKSNSIPTVSSKGCSCHASCAMYILIPRPCLVPKKFCTVLVTSNLWTHI